MSKSFWLLSAGLTAFAAPAYADPATSSATADAQPAAQPAQPATTAPADNGTDIVVTAQGRRRLLEDVPLAVQAVGGEQL